MVGGEIKVDRWRCIHVITATHHQPTETRPAEKASSRLSVTKVLRAWVQRYPARKMRLVCDGIASGIGFCESGSPTM